MSRIRILPSEVSVKIAAGEVIENPQSAVKELVENSLDAGATEIRIELLDGGKGLIRVTDNGCGMNREDALVCFERHSTSKIKEEGDLERISTLGFRGEALPSISSVSRVVLKTSTGKGGQGTLIRREGEKALEVADTAFPKGTSIEVSDLFFNLPARKKFLKTERSELTRTARYLTNAALSYPQVGFSLRHGRREVFNHPSVAGLKERIFQIYGRSVLETLMEVDYRNGERKLYGFASIPPHGRRDRQRQLFFVNKRPVKDKTLQAALNQGFRGFLEKGLFAEAFLFLDIPYADVDVNVHPAKSEVRFKDARLVFQFIFRSIEQAVLKKKGVKDIYAPRADETPRYWIKDKPGSRGFVYEQKRLVPEEPAEPFQPKSFEDKRETDFPRVLGQYGRAYIVAADREGIFIIDQHNAHERVLFDRFQEIDQKKPWPRKMSLVSVLVDLSPEQELALEAQADLLQEMGFRVEPMGGRSYGLKEYPDIFTDEGARDVFLSLLEDIRDGKAGEKRKKMLATMACKAAVKYGEPLTLEKMTYLTEELFKTDNPSICPHGRPIVVRITKDEIEKGLKRK